MVTIPDFDGDMFQYDTLAKGHTSDDASVSPGRLYLS